MQYLS